MAVVTALTLCSPVLGEEGLNVPLDQPALVGYITTNEAFAASLAIGDFDGDGLDDLALSGFPSADGTQGAGFVRVLYGGELSGPGQIWDQDSTGIAGAAEASDGFGQELAVGNFNGDAYDDLAIGVPFEDWETTPVEEDVGAVHVLYGSASGLTAAGSQLWQQGQNGLLNGREEFDRFGFALAVGNFDGDSYPDLAVGAPGDAVAGSPGAARGMVQILYGSAAGLTAIGDQILWEGAADVEGISEDGDLWGWRLAAANLDEDAYDDLVVATPWEDIITVDSFPDVLEDVGSVHILYGSADGPSGDRDVQLTHDTSNVEGQAVDGENLGWSLATGDLDGDDYDDIAVGIFDYTVGFLDPVPEAGGVHLFYGGSTGVDLSRDRILSENVVAPGAAEADDGFGTTLAIGDFDLDGFDDLAVGVPGEDVDGIADIGQVHVLYGSDSVFPASTQTWTRGADGLCCVGEAQDRFGEALAVGEIDGLPGIDLVIGAPKVDLTLNDTNYVNAGRAYLLIGSNALFRDGFEIGSTLAWE